MDNEKMIEKEDAMDLSDEFSKNTKDISMKIPT